MEGTIRFVGNYTDGKERFEIWLRHTEGFPIVYNQRLAYNIKIGTSQYLAGIRFTERFGGWICPDLRDLKNSSKKIRLSEILLSNGFKRNEPVNIKVDQSNKEITIQKLS